MAERILIVEDEPSMAEAVAYALEQEGFEAVLASDGKVALEKVEEQPPDLVILDLMLPGISGWDLFRAFRRYGNVPVIMLTARVEETDRVAGLELGADDYVTKPFSMRELMARVRAVLRRTTATPPAGASPIISRAGLSLDTERHEVQVDGEPVALSPKEFDLLAYLVKHSGRVRTRGQILEAVWGESEYLDERTVDVHIRWLRRKIETDPANPRRLITVHGVGYRFAGG